VQDWAPVSQRRVGPSRTTVVEEWAAANSVRQGEVPLIAPPPADRPVDPRWARGVDETLGWLRSPGRGFRCPVRMPKVDVPADLVQLLAEELLTQRKLWSGATPEERIKARDDARRDAYDRIRWRLLARS
jgi:hypothetical protein